MVLPRKTSGACVPLPIMIKTHTIGNVVKPTDQGIALANRNGSTRQNKKSRLEGILRVIDIHQGARTNTYHHSSVSSQHCFKCELVVLVHECLEQGATGRSFLGQQSCCGWTGPLVPAAMWPSIGSLASPLSALLCPAGGKRDGNNYSGMDLSIAALPGHRRWAFG